MIPAILAAVAVFLVACTKDKEEEAAPYPPSGGEGDSYDLKVDGRSVTLFHSDTNKDGRVQTADEKTSIAIDGTHYHGPEAFDQQSRLGLPSFEGYPIAKWFAVHSSVFREGTTSKKEAQLTEIVSYSDGYGDDPEDVLQMAKTMGGRTPLERMNSLTVAAFLKGLPRGLYYNARGENSRFIDEVTARIYGKEIHLSLLSPQSGLASAIYVSNTDTLELGGSEGFRINDWRTKGEIIHEMKHAYHDAEELDLSVLESEQQAFLETAEFLLEEALQGSSTTQARLDAFINEEYLKKGLPENRPQVLALRVAWEERQKSGPSALRQKLADSINHVYTMHAGQKQRAAIMRFIQNDLKAASRLGNPMDFLGGKITEHKKISETKWRELEKALEERAMPEVVNEKIAAVTGEELYLFIVQEALAQTKAGVSWNLAVPDTKMKEIVSKIAALNPFRRASAGYDGVHHKAVH